MEEEGILGERPRQEPAFRAMLESLRDIPIVGGRARRGLLPGHRARQGPRPKASFSDEESEDLLRGFLSGELFRRGLICRATTAAIPSSSSPRRSSRGPEHFEEIEAILRPTLEEATRRMSA
jgi:hypothetical protein